MVKRAHWFSSALFAFLVSTAVLGAKDLSAYRIGDRAGEDIATPFAIEVVDADGTAARKASEALRTPAIFRSYPNPTNAMVKDFAAAFDKERTAFATGFRGAGGEITNADDATNSAAFARFFSSFNRRKNNAFPVSAELAGLWARGESGDEYRDQLTAALVAVARRSIRPDETTNSPLGETLRLAPVDSTNAPLTLAEAEQRGKIVTLTSVTTVGRLRDLFRRSFSQSDQALGRAIGKFLRPNCDYDARLTQEVRDREVSQIVVLAHFSPGQMVVRQGDAIDAKAFAAIAQLAEKQQADRLSAQLVAQRDQLQKEQAQREQLQREQAQAKAQAEAQRLAAAEAQRVAAVKAREQEANLQSQNLAVRSRNAWLLVALAGVSLAGLGLVWWLVRRRRVETNLLPVRAGNLAVMPVEALSPHIAQAVKEAVVQSLAAQRAELLRSQQSAHAEIAELVRRLDELKAPMQERLASYQARIGELEKELADQSRENRELLKAKIEMLREKIESERSPNRVGFN